ncbi:MAG: ABC transporter permease [Parasporobacterium sp.]|nr:ABC transporter permease [Parasporobacterium sp.]
MIKFIIKRILWMIPIFLGVLVIVFCLSYFMPGDPVQDKLGSSYTQEDYDALAHEMGLDRPFLVQMGDYIWGVVTRFDLGNAYSSNQTVLQMISARVPVSLAIGLLGTLLVIVLGIPIGVFSALKQNTVADYTITTFSIILASLPGFWLALMCIIVFCLNLRWLPASGLGSFKAWILPVVTNSLMSLASVTRMTRSSMLEVIRQDYIWTAKAKGLPSGKVIFKHALKNSLIPVITMVGGQLGIIVGGSVITETIFNIPGMGMLMVTAINKRDYPLILGITVIISIFVMVMNLLVDIVYSLIDPRIKSQFKSGKKMFIKKNDISFPPVKGQGGPGSGLKEAKEA